MIYENGIRSIPGIRRKVFISFYHKEDESYKKLLETCFGHLFISKSVQPGEINTDVGDEYIKRLIQEDYISDASVLLVLIGQNTWARKHVDWEISAALNKKVGGYSGVAGIVLPTLKPMQNGNYANNHLPARLLDNLNTNFAQLWTWEYALTSEANMKKIIETAFVARVSSASKIDNSRLQMGENKCW
jgi:hypothetical protein